MSEKYYTTYNQMEVYDPIESYIDQLQIEEFDPENEDIKPKKKLLKQNKEVQYPVKKVQIPMRIDANDSYYWCDFVSEMSHVFTNKESLLKSFLKNYPRVLAYIRKGDGFFLQKDGPNDLYTQCKVSEKFKTKFKYTDTEVIIDKRKKIKGKIISSEKCFISGKETKTVKIESVITMEELLEELQNKIPMYSTMVNKPRNIGMNKHEFNIWNEFVGQSGITSPDMEKVKPILNYLKDVMSNGDETIYKYQLSWLNNAVKDPVNKPGVALVFLSKQGAGKGCWTNFLSKYIFGHRCSRSVCGLSSLTQRFNSDVEGAYLLCVDEMSSTSKKFHADYDKMKHLITEPFIMVEPKGFKRYRLENYSRIIMSTNNSNMLKIENSDRRYAIFNLSEDRIGDYDFWSDLNNKVLTEEGGKHFYSYLMNMNKDTLVNIRKIPNTKLKDEIKEMSEDNVTYFIKQVISGEYTLNKQLFIQDMKIQPSKLFQLYKIWCEENNEKPYRSRNFYVTAKKHMNKQRETINGNQVWFYDLELEMK